MASAYPTATNLEDFLEAHGITASSALTTLCTPAINASIAEFERRTDRKPFLASASAIEKRYDPPTHHADGASVLFLRRDLASLTTLIYTPRGSTATTLTEGTDFDLLPSDARDTDLNQPYTRIAFYSRRWTEPLAPALRRSLYITGKWGYHDTVLPDDVYFAMLAGGALALWTQFRGSVTGNIASWSDGDRRVEYGVEVWTRYASEWGDTVKRAVGNYRRMTV